MLQNTAMGPVSQWCKLDLRSVTLELGTSSQCGKKPALAHFLYPSIFKGDVWFALVEKNSHASETPVGTSFDPFRLCFVKWPRM